MAVDINDGLTTITAFPVPQALVTVVTRDVIGKPSRGGRTRGLAFRFVLYVDKGRIGKATSN